LLLFTSLSAAHLTNPPRPETPPALTPDWNDIACVTAALVDANNTGRPDSATVIHFAATGPGKIIAVNNGNLINHDAFQSPTPEKHRKLYDGHAIESSAHRTLRQHHHHSKRRRSATRDSHSKKRTHQVINPAAKLLTCDKFPLLRSRNKQQFADGRPTHASRDGGAK
jgi:hypothetical protein